jgi:RimJ/RimL family protein N-acetyltransferase
MTSYGNFSLRAADIDDSEKILSWRNDEQTREMSLNSEEIVFDTHLEWFLAALASPVEHLYIGILDGEEIGIVRFSQIEGDSTVVGINLNPKYRGAGLGKKILSQGIEKLRHDLADSIQVTAEIRVDNIASILTFERCGFIEIGSSSNSNFRKYRLID